MLRPPQRRYNTYKYPATFRGGADDAVGRSLTTRQLPESKFRNSHTNIAPKAAVWASTGALHTSSKCSSANAKQLMHMWAGWLQALSQGADQWDIM